MKKITLLIFLCLGITSFGQQLYIEGGKTMSSFDYKNSQGGGLDNLHASPHSFMALGYRNQIFTKKLNVSSGVSYAGYGAIGSDDSVGNYMEWDINYLEFNVGLDYELFKIKNGNLYLKGMTSMSFLLQGTQTINNRVIDLKNNDNFNKTMFDFRGGIGFAHPISENLSFSVQYMYGKSLELKEDTANNIDQEELRIVSNNVSFGLLINIAKKITTSVPQLTTKK